MRIVNSMRIQVSVVLTGVKRTIFFSNKEGRGSLRRLGGNDLSGFKVFINESFASLMFFRVKRVYLSNFWNKQHFEINGVIVQSVRGETVVGFLRKYVFKV